MKKGLIVLDFDGTLYNTSLANFFAYRDALSAWNIKLDKDLYISSYAGQHYQYFLRDFIQENEIISKVHELKKKLYKNYYSQIKENTCLFDLLSCLKERYYLSILTNASKKNCLEILEYFNKQNYFDYIITADDINKKKLILKV